MRYCDRVIIIIIIINIIIIRVDVARLSVAREFCLCWCWWVKNVTSRPMRITYYGWWALLCK